MKPEDTTEEITEEELVELIKKGGEETLNLPLPQSWYKKYDIPLPKPESVKDVCTNMYYMKCAIRGGSEPPILMKTPDDFVCPEIPEVKYDLEVISKPVEPVEVT